jgi:hypothetical protein
MCMTAYFRRGLWKGWQASFSLHSLKIDPVRILQVTYSSNAFSSPHRILERVSHSHVADDRLERLFNGLTVHALQWADVSLRPEATAKCTACCHRRAMIDISPGVRGLMTLITQRIASMIEQVIGANVCFQLEYTLAFSLVGSRRQ